MRRLWAILMPYIGGLLPIIGLFLWGMRRKVVRLADQAEFPDAATVIGRSGSGFYLYAETRSGVRRYEVGDVRLAAEAWESGASRVDALLSGRCKARRYSFKSASIAVRGSPEKYLEWKRHVDALREAKRQEEEERARAAQRA